MKQLHVSNIKEIVMEIVFLICACISILSVALICIFLFSNGIPGIAKIGLKEFLLGTEWKPGSNLFGIFSTIVGSIYVTIGAIIVGVPVGLLMAVFMAKFCPKKLYKILKPGVELLAGIPSVVYGFFGLMVLVPFVRNTFRPILMQYQMSTLGELLDTFSNRSVYQEFQFLSQTAAHMQQQTPFVQAWSEQVQAEKHLSPEVKEVLLELGEELGRTDLEGQLSALSQAHIQLQRFQDTYRVTYQKKGKLYRSLGLLAGLLLAVLFC